METWPVFAKSWGLGLETGLSPRMDQVRSVEEGSSSQQLPCSDIFCACVFEYISQQEGAIHQDYTIAEVTVKYLA